MRERHQGSEPRGREERVAAPASGRFWGPAVVMTFSFLLGLIALGEFRSSPFFRTPIIDEEGYIRWAQAILSGEAGGRVFYQDPLYPYFLALVFSLFGPSLLVVRLLQVAMGTGACGLVWWTGKQLGGEKAGVAGAVLFALMGPVYFFELMILKAALLLLLSAAALALAVWAAERPARGVRFFLVGITFGLLSLLRGNFLLLLPLAGLWAYFLPGEGRGKRRLYSLLSFALGTGLIIFPATVHNWRAGGEFVLTTSQAGPNFYIGNSEFATGRYQAPPFVYPSPLFEARHFREEAERRSGRRLSAGQVSRFWMREGLIWIRDHPGQAARLWLHKTRLLIHHFEIPDNQDFYITRDYFCPSIKIAFLGLGLLWGPALLGMVLSLRRFSLAIFPVLFTFAYALSLVPFFIVARYRIPLLPGAAIFAALFGVWLREQWRARNLRSLFPAAAFTSGALLLALWPTRESATPDGTSAFNLANAYFQAGQPGQALWWHRRALEVEPDNEHFLQGWQEAVRALGREEKTVLFRESERAELPPAQLFELGRKLEALDEKDRAAEIYRRILRREPEFFSAHARLAALLATGSAEAEIKAALHHLHKALTLRPDYTQQAEARQTLEALRNYYFQALPRNFDRWQEEVLGERGGALSPP